MNTLIINADELWLKGGKRSYYLKILKKHVRWVLLAHQLSEFKIKTDNQRIVLKTKEIISDKLIKALQKIAGIHSLAPVKAIPLDYSLLGPAILEQITELKTLPQTFRIKCHRANKQFPKTSVEIEREMGGVVLEKYPHLKVRLKNAELSVDIKISSQQIYVATNRLLGIGGLPVSSTGHVASLLSGGIDSPVASYLMIKRGCRVTYVFFHAYPFVGDEVKEKIIRLAQQLAPYQTKSRLYIIPFGHLQQYIVDHCHENYRTLLFRHFMLATTSKIGDQIGVDALLTGDSLSQVSSQTIKNITLLDQSCEKSIFRPLIGLNKSEIIQLAQQIGTFETSIIPHDDACSLLAPEQPVVKPFRIYWHEFLKEHQAAIDTLIQECIDRAQIFKFDCLGAVAAPPSS